PIPHSAEESVHDRTAHCVTVQPAVPRPELPRVWRPSRAHPQFHQTRRQSPDDLLCGHSRSQHGEPRGDACRVGPS
ncbi:hypothetical protein NMM52_21365, partial [Acinetobacter baumannii]|nr:hypothetical protein [Acinetobacter baumannii]